MRPAFAPRLAVPLLGLALGLATRPAAAQPVDPQKLAAAQVLFEQAQTAMDRKDYASACPKLEEVTHLLPNGVGGLLTLARCYEGEGRLASAWSGYLVAQNAAAMAKRPELEKQARERGVALKPKLAQLTIGVPEAIRALPGLSILRDGVPIGAAQWGTPVPIDKGKHVIAASATGKQRWEREVSVEANGATVSVDVAALADAPAGAAGPAPGDGAPNAKPDVTFVWGRPQVAGAAIAGGGLLGVVVGAVSGAVALVKKNQSNDGHCVVNNCDPTGVQLRSDGLTAATVSTATFIIGSAALVVGVTALKVPWGKPVDAQVHVGLGTLNVSAAW